MAPEIVDAPPLADFGEIGAERAMRKALNAMASVATFFEEELAAASYKGRAGKTVFGVALGAVRLHVLGAGKFGFVGGLPVGLGGKAEQRLWPVLVFTVGVEGIEAAPLAVVADGAAKVREFVTALPAAVFLDVSERGGIAVGVQRLGVSLEARVVAGDVAGSAAIDARFAELGDDDLLDARLGSVDGLALGIGFGQAARLFEIGRLVLLPAVQELIVENDPVHNQHHQTGNCQR